jgi:rod shape-determining protein MreC
VERPPGPLRTVLVVLCIVALLGVYVATRRGTAATRRVAAAAAQAVAPAQTALWRAAAWVAGDVAYVRSLVRAEREVARLKAELAQARFAVLRERAAVSQDRTLRAVLHLRQDLAMPTVAAEVVGLSPASWWESLTIDRGSADGVTAGAPVLAPGGVVGRVWTVAPHTAAVMLLANGESGVGVMDARSGALGVALGDSVPQRLTVDFFSPTAAVRAGDALVTSGLGGVFPRGLPVARVDAVSQGPTGLVSATATPAVDPTTVSTVLVVETPGP